MDDAFAAALSALDPESFGSRLRDLRRARSLRQGDLAGGDISIGYVSRIEAGQRRPDRRLIELFAKRLGVSAEELLGLAESDASLDATRLAEAQVQWLLQHGDPTEATQLAQELDAGQEHGRAKWRGRLLHAQALEAAGDLQGAIDRLIGVVESSDGAPNVEACIALSRCYREAGEFSRSIRCGEDALLQLRKWGISDSDGAIQLTLTVAAAYCEQGDLNQAVRLCTEARERAESSGSVLARASAYWEASVLESRRGATESAVMLAEQALQLMRQQTNALNFARLQGQLGIMLLRLDPPNVEAAVSALAAARHQLAENNGSAIDIAKCDVALARADMLRGDDDAAGARARKAIGDMNNQAPIVQTEAYLILGELAVQERDTDRARMFFGQAAAALTAAGADRAAAQLWFDVAARSEAVGDAETALEAYRSASVAAGLLPTALMRATAPR